MGKNDGIIEYVTKELLSDISGITTKKMFGGYALYKDSIIFGMVAEGRVYFKVGEGNKKQFEEYKSKAFSFEMKNGKKTETSYWELPEEVMEDKVALEIWILSSVKESLRAKKKQ